MEPPTKEFLLFHGNSHPELAKLVARHLNVNIAKFTLCYSTNREIMLKLEDNVEARDVFILQTGSMNVNDDVMEVLTFVYACKTGNANTINVVMPYLPYCKQNRMNRRGCIVSQLLANMLCRAGMDLLITLDLHSKEIQGFYTRPVENLRTSPFLIQYIKRNMPDWQNAVIVAGQPSSAPRAASYANRLGLPLAVVYEHSKTGSEASTDGRHSPPLNDKAVEESLSSASESSFTSTKCSKLSKFTLVGNVSGSVAIIVDDIVDEMDDFAVVADLLCHRGAYKVFLAATHGMFSGNATFTLEASRIDGVLVTNTIPHDFQEIHSSKIATVDVSALVAEAIRRVHNRESMSALFTNVPEDD